MLLVHAGLDGSVGRISENKKISSTLSTIEASSWDVLGRTYIAGSLSKSRIDECTHLVGGEARRWQGGAEQGDVLLGVHHEVVPARGRVVAHHGVHVRELGLDEDRPELGHVGDVAVDKDDVDNVVADVALPFDLAGGGKMWSL